MQGTPSTANPWSIEFRWLTLLGSYTGQGLDGSNRGSDNITSGAPAAWVNDSYVTATPWASDAEYAALRVYDGWVFNHANWGMNVALQVL